VFEGVNNFVDFVFCGGVDENVSDVVGRDERERVGA
jgi:hypothetical protein